MCVTHYHGQMNNWLGLLQMVACQLTVLAQEAMDVVERLRCGDRRCENACEGGMVVVVLW